MKMKSIIMVHGVTKNMKSTYFSSNVSKRISVQEKIESKFAFIFRRLKIFKVMEQLIESRSSIQCRSHHVKLMRTNKTIPSLINKYKRSVGFKKYADRFKKLQT